MYRTAGAMNQHYLGFGVMAYIGLRVYILVRVSGLGIRVLGFRIRVLGSRIWFLWFFWCFVSPSTQTSDFKLYRFIVFPRKLYPKPKSLIYSNLAFAWLT